MACYSWSSPLGWASRKQVRLLPRGVALTYGLVCTVEPSWWLLVEQPIRVGFLQAGGCWVASGGVVVVVVACMTHNGRAGGVTMVGVRGAAIRGGLLASGWVLGGVGGGGRGGGMTHMRGWGSRVTE